MKKLNTINLLSVEKFNLTLEDTFNKLLSNFAETPTKIFNLLESIILSCVLIEAIVKSELKLINPTLLLNKIDTEDVAIISGKISKLIYKATKVSSSVKSAPISILLERLSKFRDISKYQSGLNQFILIRNKIIHAAENVELNQDEINLLLAKYIFPYIKEYISVNRSLWQDIEQIAKVSGNYFKESLMKSILAHRKIAQKIKPEKIGDLINSNPYEESEDIPESTNLVCPACGNPSISFLRSPDFDYSDGESYIVGIYINAKCRVCNLDLHEIEIQEVIKNYASYFSNKLTKKQITAWEEHLDIPEYDYAD